MKRLPRQRGLRSAERGSSGMRSAKRGAGKGTQRMINEARRGLLKG